VVKGRPPISEQQQGHHYPPQQVVGGLFIASTTGIVTNVLTAVHTVKKMNEAATSTPYLTAATTYHMAGISETATGAV
jgi:hypothetical protein